jgi:hypothetical protein
MGIPLRTGTFPIARIHCAGPADLVACRSNAPNRTAEQ